MVLSVACDLPGLSSGLYGVFFSHMVSTALLIMGRANSRSVSIQMAHANSWDGQSVAYRESFVI